MTPMEMWYTTQIEAAKHEQPKLRRAYTQAKEELAAAKEKWLRFVPGYIRHKEKLAKMTKRKLRASHNRLHLLKEQALESNEMVMRLRGALNASKKAVEKLEKIKAAYTYEMSVNNSEVSPAEITEMYKLVCLCSIDEDMTYQTISTDPEMLTEMMEDCLAKHKSHVQECEEELARLRRGIKASREDVE